MKRWLFLILFAVFFCDITADAFDTDCGTHTAVEACHTCLCHVSMVAVTANSEGTAVLPASDLRPQNTLLYKLLFVDGLFHPPR